MVISSLDTNYTATSITRYVTIKKTSGKFTAPKISTYYRSGRIYTVKLINANNKNPMYGAKVNIKVFISKNRYYNYTGVTDGNGKVNLKVSYKPGTYKVVVGSADKGYTAKSVNGQIKVAKHPIKMNPTSLKVKKGTNFKVKVISSKTKKVLSNVKVKVKVYTGKKYKTYTIKTNSKGIASLKITLKPKTYTVSATYKGFTVKNKVKVKPTIVTKNLSKKKAKIVKFTAKLLNSKGAILKYKYITFKFKSKKYKRKTNKYGIATLSLKNLRKGKYVIYSTYGKLTVKNTIRIK